MKTNLSQRREQFKNVYNTGRIDLMNSNNNLKSDTYNRLVEALPERATARRLEITNNHNSPMDVDMVHDYIQNGRYEHEHVDRYSEDYFYDEYRESRHTYKPGISKGDIMVDMLIASNGPTKETHITARYMGTKHTHMEVLIFASTTTATNG